MRSKQNPTICKETRKVVLSESQAYRRVRDYEQIRRYYKCEECGGYHITSMGIGLAIQEGIDIDIKRDNGVIDQSIIERRMNKLIKKSRK